MSPRYVSAFPQRFGEIMKELKQAEIRLPRGVIAILFISIAFWASPLSMSAEPPQQNGLEKIAPWVMQQTENGQESEFLVVLADQADLNAADALPSKKEKGRYVYEMLFRKAEATQGPILQQLRERNIEHQSFYIVNMIRVRGNRSAAIELAARPDVARVDSNISFQQALPVLLPENRLQVNAPAAVEPNISYVNAPALWAMGFTGQEVVVGGQDTGYQWDHPALQSHYRGGMALPPAMIITGMTAFTPAADPAAQMRLRHVTTTATARTRWERPSAPMAAATVSAWRPERNGSDAGI